LRAEETARMRAYAQIEPGLVARNEPAPKVAHVSADAVPA